MSAGSDQKKLKVPVSARTRATELLIFSYPECRKYRRERFGDPRTVDGATPELSGTIDAAAHRRQIPDSLHRTKAARGRRAAKYVKKPRKDPHRITSTDPVRKIRPSSKSQQIKVYRSSLIERYGSTAIEGRVVFSPCSGGHRTRPESLKSARSNAECKPEGAHAVLVHIVIPYRRGVSGTPSDASQWCNPYTVM